MDYKVLITTSGVGQRLGELTKYTNKSLVRVGKKPALSYIIESYDPSVPLVITVGYFGNQVQEFVQLAYPERKVQFVYVDKYEGEGSSLGYSMLCAKDYLQCPFIYHACDTLITDRISPPHHNWIGVYKGDDSSQYASWRMLDESNFQFNEKGAIDFDYLHIGLVGIESYQNFWDNLQNLFNHNPLNATLNDCQVIEQMLAQGQVFNLKEFSTWYDIGNISSLQHARSNVGEKFDNLDKVDESIFIFDDFVIKFFYDQNMVKERVERAKILTGFVPGLLGATNNFYKYQYVPGEVYSRAVTAVDFKKFLGWAHSKLWTPLESFDKQEFKKICRNFYYDKTLQRIEKFLEKNALKDQSHTINSESVPSFKELMGMIDFDALCTAEPTVFHGDFILENVLKTPQGDYCLVDWRQNFGGSLEAGDMYYDIAKLNHNLVVNHDIIKDNLFTITVHPEQIECDILRRHNLVMCQEVLRDFIAAQGLNRKKVELLTGLIWLNMSPLHHYPFNMFLYYFGKLNLWKALQLKN